MSIDTLMATPFPTDLVAAPTGGAIAWVSSNSGVHNILIAEPAPGTGPMAGRTDHKWRAVTNYTGDDGLWITEPGFTSDAKTIVYVRGDGANRQGESPNPAQLQDGTEQAVFAVPVAGGTPKRLGAGQRRRAVTARPARGLGVARADLERRSRDHRSAGAARQRARQRVGTRVVAGRIDARVHERPRHAQLHRRVHARVERAALHRSVARSRRQRGVVAGWIADRVDSPGRGAARADVFAAPRSRRTVVAARRRRQDRQAKQVWKADAGYGSAFQGVVADSQLYWGAGDRLVFPWEKDGWLHLYSVPAAGGSADAADAGQLRSRVREHRARSARDDLQLEPGRHRQRHVWTVPVDGSAKPARTAAEVDRQRMAAGRSTSDGLTACMHADAQMPPHVMVIWPDGNAHSLLENMLPAASIRRALVDAAAGDDHRDRRHADPRAAVPAEGSEGRREAAGADLLPRRIAPADAARLALQLLLPQRLRDESVAREPGLHRAVGELSQRHRLRPRVPRSAQLRRVGRRGVQRRDGRGPVSEGPRRCRSGAHRTVGRIVRRLSHRDGPVARLGSVRRRRRLPRRARLEPGHQHVRARLQRARRSGLLARARLQRRRWRASTPGSRRCC